MKIPVRDDVLVRMGVFLDVIMLRVEPFEEVNYSS